MFQFGRSLAASFRLGFLTLAMLPLLALTAPGFAQEKSEAPEVDQEKTDAFEPELVGMSSARLKRIDDAIQRHIDAKHISGAVTLVARRGMVVQNQAYGVKDLETKEPMTLDAIFKMASTSKPVTAVAIMILVEEGKIRVTDPVSKFIPEFKEMQVATQKEGSSEVTLVKADREITILDLLTHRSGLLSGGLGSKQVPPDTQFPKPDETLATAIPRLAKVPLDFQPGTRWSYSGLAGIDTLARIVEVVSGQTFDEFLKQRIFEPLGMTDTSFVVPDDKLSRMPTIYRMSPEGLQKSEFRLTFPKEYYSGAGGLCSTASDFFRFAQMLVNGGQFNDIRVLGPRAVSIYSSNHVGEMFRNQLGRGEGMGFGFAVEVMEDPIAINSFRSRGSYGWDGAFGTHFWVDPREQLVAVLMIQSQGGRVVHHDFETAVMQAIIDQSDD